MRAPDGVVDLFNDIVGVIQQFGHDCREAQGVVGPAEGQGSRAAWWVRRRRQT